MFAPHQFATSVTGCPKVVVSHEAYNDMAILVQEVGTEVGWLGTVKKEGQVFTIERIFLVAQQAAAATTEISPEGVAALTMELLELPNGMDLVNAMRFWGHSHVNMGTSPSGQDNDQMKLFQDNGCEWFVRGIFNKARRAQFDIYYFALGFAFFDVEWSIEDQEGTARRTFWKGEIEEKVKPLTYHLPPAGAYSYKPYEGTYGGTPYKGGLPPYDRHRKTQQEVIREVQREMEAAAIEDEEAALSRAWNKHLAEQEQRELNGMESDDTRDMPTMTVD